MDITPAIDQGANFISSYSKNSFKVREQTIEGDIILTPSIVINWQDADDLMSEASYRQIFSLKAPTENIILIVGTGTTHLLPPASLKFKLSESNINIEMMSTPAACSTYNILLSEGRKIIAALKLAR